MKILVIGLNPSSVPESVKVRKNSTLDRLFRWMSQCGVDYFSFMNAFDEKDSSPHSSKFDIERICTVSVGYDKIIALGGMVSKCLTKLNIEHFPAPHPSPRNRVWNDKKFEPNLLKKMDKFVKT